MDEIIKVRFFKDGSDDFVSLLESNGIAYKKASHFPLGTILNTSEALDIVKALADLSLVPSITAVIIQWLKNKASRKVILQTKDNEVIHLEGYSVKEIEPLISKTRDIIIIQTEKE